MASEAFNIGVNHREEAKPPEFFRKGESYYVQADWPGKDRNEVQPAFNEEFARDYWEGYNSTEEKQLKPYVIEVVSRKKRS